jgi:hypothetical protein
MRAIYSKASRPVVWLGPENNFSSLAMSTLAGLRTSLDWLQISDTAKRAIGALFSRSWVERVWTIHEFSLGKDVEFRCGPDSLLWSGVESVLRDVLRAHDREWRWLFPLERESKKASSELLDSLTRPEVWRGLIMDRGEILVPAYGNWKKSHSLHALLDQHIGLEATRGRVRIYGLLGLAEKHGIKLSDPSPAPIFDYHKTDEQEPEIFTEWARWIIETEKNLDILF